MSLSIIILTKNEELILPSALQSIAWCDDVHIVDSFSTDSTLDIATSFGAKAYQNKFISFAAQRNWALDNCHLKYDWILFLDADERSTEEFQSALTKAVSEAGETVVGFYCCWKMILNETWLKRSDSFPKWQFRVLKNGDIRFKDSGHGQKEDLKNGMLEYISVPYLHYAFRKGWGDWLERHNRYSSDEALYRSSAVINYPDIFSKHPSKRKIALKVLASRLFCWPILKFILDYLLKLGFLDGKGAFTYCFNMAYYEYLIQIKIREIEVRRANIG